MNFPANPTIGDTYTLGDKTWEWTGVAWDLLSTSDALVLAAETAAADSLSHAGDSAASAAAAAATVSDINDLATAAAASADAAEGSATAAASSAADAAATKSLLDLNAQTGTAYTLALTDAGKRVSMANAAANVLTVPPNGTVAFPLNTIVFVSQDGLGATSIAPDTGVTINTAEGLNVGGQYKMASLIKTATDTWLAVGTIA